MTTHLEQAFQHSVKALTGVDLDSAEAEQALRREACELLSEMLREYVRDGECSVTVRFSGVSRELWEGLPFGPAGHHVDVKVEDMHRRLVVVEYEVAPEAGRRVVIHDGRRVVREVAS